MNQLAFATLTLLIAPAAGCVIETRESGGGYGADYAAISARWSLRNMLDGAVTACPRGFDTVQVVAQAIDERGVPYGDPSVDLFDCDDRSGLSAALYPDVYQVWLEVRSHDLGELYAQSLSQVLDVRDVDQQFSTELLNDGGYFQLSWDLVGEASNRPLGCAQVPGIGSILAISTSVADARRAYDDWFTCEDHAAVSGGLLQGSYTITIDAMAADKSIGRVTSLTDQTISGQNRVTDLGYILIPIDGR